MGAEKDARSPHRPLTGAVWCRSLAPDCVAELIQLRIGLRQYGVNLSQIAARLNSGGTAPVWLPQVIAGGERVLARVDEAAMVLCRRFR